MKLYAIYYSVDIASSESFYMIETLHSSMKSALIQMKENLKGHVNIKRKRKSFEARRTYLSGWFIEEVYVDSPVINLSKKQYDIMMRECFNK